MILAPVVGDAMLRHPTVHSAGLTVGQARAAFDASPKTHLLLLVRGQQLVGTLTRDDLVPRRANSDSAAALSSLSGRTVSPDASLEATRNAMLGQRIRRLAVVDPSMRLLGLLCLQRGLDGFCSDEVVVRMRAGRRTTATGRP